MTEALKVEPANPLLSAFLQAVVSRLVAHIRSGLLNPFAARNRLVLIVQNTALRDHVRAFAREVIIGLGDFA